MKMYLKIAASAATLALAPAASAQTVYNDDMKTVTGGTSTTVTNDNGTVTTVTGARQTATDQSNWYQANLGGGASVGITRTYSNDGDGAAYFASTGSAGKADLQFNFAAPVALSSLTSASFDYFVDSSSADTLFAPVLRFTIFKGNSFAGSLVLEGYYQNNLAPTQGVWASQASTLSSGKWWATNAALGPTFAAANGGVKTLQEWIDANAGSTLSVVQVNVGIGSGWAGSFAGAADNVAFSFAGGPSADYNFAVVPEPASWAMMIGGFGFVGAAARRRSRKAVFA